MSLHRRPDFITSSISLLPPFYFLAYFRVAKKPKHFPPIKDSAAAEVQKVSRLPDLAREGIDEMFMRAEGADGECVCARARAYRQF